MNHMMLRFRPIAPKPAASGESDAAAPVPESGRGAWRREKRKYVRARDRQCARKKKSPPPKISGDLSPDKSAVTLQLLPERSETEEKSCENSTDRTSSDYGGGVSGEVTEERSGDGSEVLETVIVVERVTDMFAEDRVGLGFSDEEKIYGLEKDTCPGFVSDMANSVIWMNGAFKEMVGKEKGFVVRLVAEDVISRFYPSFACRARVVELRGQGQKWNKIMACDVWRMEFGGFAWKLDVNTALSLSL